MFVYDEVFLCDLIVLDVGVGGGLGKSLLVLLNFLIVVCVVSGLYNCISRMVVSSILISFGFRFEYSICVLMRRISVMLDMGCSLVVISKFFLCERLRCFFVRVVVSIWLVRWMMMIVSVFG